MNEIFNAFVAAVSGKLIALHALTFVDLIFGISLAVRQERFEWGKLTGYLDSNILPTFAWLAVEGIALIPADMIPGQADLFIPQVVYGTVFLKILASVAGHFSAIGVLTSPLQRVGVTPTGKKQYDLDNFLG